jgi:hypothetical protein
MSNFISFDLKETYMHCILVRREKNIRQGGENVSWTKETTYQCAKHAYVASVSGGLDG